MDGALCSIGGRVCGLLRRNRQAELVDGGCLSSSMIGLRFFYQINIGSDYFTFWLPQNTYYVVQQRPDFPVPPGHLI